MLLDSTESNDKAERMSASPQAVPPSVSDNLFGSGMGAAPNSIKPLTTNVACYPSLDSLKSLPAYSELLDDDDDVLDWIFAQSCSR